MVLETQGSLSPVWPPSPINLSLQIKSLAKAAVLQYWLYHLRAQADSLSSLKYMQSADKVHGPYKVPHSV